jgi:c-di-GMP-binding flagellar brake protein YcgR
MSSPANRRRYPRIAAPVFYRPAEPSLLHHRRAAVDVSLGGIRTYADDELAVGTRLEIELVLDDDVTARCWARIAWVEKLDDGAGAAYDIGLEFIDMSEKDRELLSKALRSG